MHVPITPMMSRLLSKVTTTSDLPRIQGSELLSVSEEANEAAIGISRIWTSKGSRKKGIAKALLKCVAKTFLTKVTAKDMVAFSQPTEMGTALARRWFGQEYGWHVYID